MKVRTVVPHIWFGSANRVGSGMGRRSGPYIYNIFNRLSLTVSCLNHISSFSLEGVSIPTCFTHLHTYFPCLATMSLNLDVVPFY